MKYLIHLSILLFSCLSFCQECDEVKTGNFLLTDERVDYEGEINRNDTIQTEINKKTGHITKGTVDWIDDCTYKMTYRESNSPMVKNYIGKSITTQIIRINEGIIYFKCWMGGIDFIAEGQMKIID